MIERVSVQEAPKLVHLDAHQLIATWKNVVVCQFGITALTEEAARRQVAICTAHGQRFGPGQLLEIVLIDRDTPLPTPGGRAVLDAAASAVGPYYLGVACVFQGVGFRAALVRGVLTSLVMLARSPFPQRIFPSDAECLTWSSEKLGASAADSADLGAFLASVRRSAVEHQLVTA